MIFGFYGLVWWLVFKKFKLLKITMWSSVTSVFIMLVTIVFLFLWLGRYQPATKYARIYTVTTPIISEVSGRVIEVVSEGGKPMKKGDVLFKIDPEPYQAKLDSLAAQLKLAEIRLKQEDDLKKQGAGNQNDLDKAKSEFDRLTSDLRSADYQLKATVVRAPADGMVTQVLIRPGQFVMPMAFAQVMVFVHAEKPYLFAGFDQNESEFIDAGDEVEVAFDSIPGRVFSGKVIAIQPLLAEGAVSASGGLRTLDDAGKRGKIPVMVEITSDVSAYNLPAGSNATVAVYTGKAHHLNIMRKIILRIKSWENWVSFH